uniref:ISAs1 family transposase n=1 Tax=Gloeocapsa sp. PCC 7428 TaxID=1173026 RepID=UPI0002E9D710|nr:ISAs1 family transposase [Gloeocapsa sp. PCC 7428]
MELLALLNTVADPRAPRGKRHPLSLVLLIILMGTMLGYWGYRPLSEFIKHYGDALRARLGLSDEVEFPSYSTLRRVMMQLDFAEFAAVFSQWAKQFVPLDPAAVVAIDGKSIKSTVSDCHQNTQAFVSVVSLFSHECGFVYQMQAMDNHNTSEQTVVQQLLKTLALDGVVVTMDALHCQKKP